MAADLNLGSHKIINVTAPTAETDAVNKKYVDDAIASGIASNDAMTFCGTVGGTDATVSNLPATANKGDTYKVNALGTYGGIDAKIGDLFINMGDDGETASWTHVTSGYEDDYLQKLKQSNGVIYLTNGVSDTDSQQGSFKVVAAAGNNLKIATTSSGSLHTITVSMEWQGFTD